MLLSIIRIPSCALSTTLVNKSWPPFITSKNYTMCKNIISSKFHSLSFSTIGLKNVRLIGITTLNKLLPKPKTGQNILRRYEQTNIMDINTNVCNNVLLYTHKDKNRCQSYLKFCMGLLVFHSVYAYYNYIPMFKSIDYKGTFAYYFNLGMFLVVTIMGSISCSVSWLYCARNVKSIILHKRGKEVTLMTYNMIKENCKLTVPVSNISTNVTRHEAKHIMPLKIKGKSFYYLVDTSGEFVNKSLFDSTIGLKRY